MARMASRPRIGAIIRDGIERKGLRQWQVAERLGVSRSAVNAWINGRAYPASYVIVALEELLEVKIPRSLDEPPAALAAPRERELYRLLLQQIDDMTPAEAMAIIEDDRQRRAKRRIA
jgi:transcriptional regulator with XRE-family HTH domain